MCNLKIGSIKSASTPSMYGVGFLDGAKTQVDGVVCKEYSLWNNMLTRCYNEKLFIENPTYEDCYVSENFKSFRYFKEWCNNQKGFKCTNEKGKPFQLDKDILVKGNKTYSEDTCVFVPPEVNKLITKANRIRGNLPIGVVYHKQNRNFVSKLSKENKTVSLGSHPTPNEAFLAYKEAKETYIKEVAELYKDQIDSRVYEALMKYEVDIND